MTVPAETPTPVVERLRARERTLAADQAELPRVRRALRAIGLADTPRDSDFVTTLRASLLAYRGQLARNAAELHAIQRELRMLERSARGLVITKPPEPQGRSSSMSAGVPAKRRPTPAIDAKVSAALLSVIQTTPGLTYTEISRLSGIDPAVASPALRGLASKAQIEQDGPRWYPR